jgi:hypothetical protein
MLTGDDTFLPYSNSQKDPSYLFIYSLFIHSLLEVEFKASLGKYSTI